MANFQTSNIARHQLSDALQKYPSPAAANPPGGGWIRAIRQALGMTQAQLGARLDVSPQAVRDYEQAEANRRITLDTLDRAARAMGCRLVYALVPEGGSLESVRERRASEVADRLLATATHSMQLEAQGVGAPETDRQRQMLVDSLLRGSPRALWK